ncbi:MAG: hypothetical protein ACJAS9_003748, partial [Polaribacter sp.]
GYTQFSGCHAFGIQVQDFILSIDVNRVWFFLTNCGSKLHSVSRGVSRSTCPSSARIDF